MASLPSRDSSEVLSRLRPVLRECVRGKFEKFPHSSPRKYLKLFKVRYYPKSRREI